MTEEREEPRRLSKAAQETLAIIAYHQPVTRAEIEAVRGVQASRGTLDVLLELGLVKMRGRRRTPGRPVTFGTTDAFLEHYGLATLGDLPGIAEMHGRRPAGPRPAAGLLGSRSDGPAGRRGRGPAGGRRRGPEFAQDFLGDLEADRALYTSSQAAAYRPAPLCPPPRDRLYCLGHCNDTPQRLMGRCRKEHRRHG